MHMTNTLTKLICGFVLIVVNVVCSFTIWAQAEKQQLGLPYVTETHIYDWGASINKIILPLGQTVNADSVTKDSFKVEVSRFDYRLTDPLIEQGEREVLQAYTVDKKGNKTIRGDYIVLELAVGPSLSLAFGLNYYDRKNAWVDNQFIIKQQQTLTGESGNLSGLLFNQKKLDKKPQVDLFNVAKTNFEQVNLTYAEFKPARDSTQNPLIIWLHGGGEGGTDATIPLSANKAVAFASDSIQAYFNGAYVLVPQAPTFWMDGFNGFKDGTSIYQSSLMALIKNYVKKHPDIDTKRIYIGGASNGGYMTMLMIRDYPNYFAAAFPVCEGLDDRLISNEALKQIKQTPTWFITAKSDNVLPSIYYTVPTYIRLLEAGARNSHLTLYDEVIDTSGLYFNEQAKPYTYQGHFSWIYVFNNHPKKRIKGKKTSLMQWLANQKVR